MKAQGKVVEYNVTTGKTTITEQEFDFSDVIPEEPKGIDFAKLKQVLLAKGIISDPREVEPTIAVVP